MLSIPSNGADPFARLPEDWAYVMVRFPTPRGPRFVVAMSDKAVDPSMMGDDVVQLMIEATEVAQKELRGIPQLGSADPGPFAEGYQVERDSSGVINKIFRVKRVA